MTDAPHRLTLLGPPIVLSRVCRVEHFDQAEQRREQRDEEASDDSDADDGSRQSRRLEAGAYSQQRLAVVMVVTAARSKAVARRIDEKLHQVRDSLLAHFGVLLLCLR